MKKVFIICGIMVSMAAVGCCEEPTVQDIFYRDLGKQTMAKRCVDQTKDVSWGMPIEGKGFVWIHSYTYEDILDLCVGSLGYPRDVVQAYLDELDHQTDAEKEYLMGL